MRATKSRMLAVPVTAALTLGLLVAAEAAAPGTGFAGSPGGSIDLRAARSAPVVTINSPTYATYHHVEIHKPPIWYDGEAVDPQDGPIPGTRLRWVATEAYSERRIVLCTGSSWPKSGPAVDPSTVLSMGRKDCSQFVSDRLHATGPRPTSHWRVELQAVDKDGNRSTASVGVNIDYKVS